MDLREKVASALHESLKLDHIQLEDDDGISGIIVSAQFRGVSAMDRQMLVPNALRKSSVKLTRADLSRILAIAPLTPAEYAAIDHAE